MPAIGSQLKSLTTLLALSAGLGIPVGAAAQLISRQMSPPAPMPSSTTFTDLPLAEHVGPERGEKVAGIVDKVRQAYLGVAKGIGDLDAASKGLAMGAGGLAGGGLGYKVVGDMADEAATGDLDTQLAERQETFNKLLLEEQMASGGYKAAELLDSALETVLDHEMRKDAGETEKTISEIVPTLLAIAGAAYGFDKGWGNTVATDRNRAIHNSLQSSLDERLMGNAEGPGAPMIVKVRTDRVGATPVSGAGGKSNKRDVLERL